MPANNCKGYVHYLAGRYPGKIGHLYSPGSSRGPYEWLPYALDNGAYVAWANQREWRERPFLELLEWASRSEFPPCWVVVPDAVGDRDATLRRWDEWEPRIRGYGWPLAMAVQDGMLPSDLPREAAVVFVGGTTGWKWRSLAMWCRARSRVHVGRVNGERWLWDCHERGAESVDGTGWFRGDKAQLAGLENYLRRTAEGLGAPMQRQLLIPITESEARA